MESSQHHLDALLDHTEEDDSNVVSLESRRRAAQANDDVEYLSATIDPAELMPAGSASFFADGVPPSGAIGDVLTRILSQLLTDTQKERDEATQQVEALASDNARLRQQQLRLVAMAKRWEQHATRIAKWANEGTRQHAHAIKVLSDAYGEEMDRLEMAMKARDESLEAMSQLVARTECNLIDALIARDAAIELARELLAEKWMRRWKREAWESRIDAILEQ